jgi:hypothetical protein
MEHDDSLNDLQFVKKFIGVEGFGTAGKPDGAEVSQHVMIIVKPPTQARSSRCTSVVSRI